MKKIGAIMFVLAFVFVIATQAVSAGGGQVTGDAGEGLVAQNGDCPFGSETPMWGPFVGPQN